jgi:uncharacterized SAM-binding protein YcdF (DUF218 family)
MFFALSKILDFLLKPVIILLALLAWSFFSKNEKRRWQLLKWALIMVVFFSNPFIGNTVFRLWEIPATSVSSPNDTADIALVLGGFSEFDVEASSDRLNFNAASNRLLDAVVLYKKGLVKKILVSGGDGRLIGKKVSEAQAVAPFLETLGIPNSDILLETDSRNTYENAFFSRQLIEKQGFVNSKVLLVTSAFHMRRALGCFAKVGLKVKPYSAHFMGEKLVTTPSSLVYPRAEIFYRWEFFIKEWVGYAVYWLKGYI